MSSPRPVLAHGLTTRKALLNEGFVRKSCFGALGKAEIQTVSMRLKPVVGLTALAVAILTATNDIRAKLTLDDDTPYFIGTYPAASVRRGARDYQAHRC